MGGKKGAESCADVPVTIELKPYPMVQKEQVSHNSFHRRNPHFGTVWTGVLSISHHRRPEEGVGEVDRQ